MDDVSVDLSGNLDVKEPLLKDRTSSLPIPITVPAAAEWVRVRHRNLRPWNTFVNSSNFHTPSSAVQLSQRLVRNVEFFQSNYLCIFLGLVVYCLLTSPFLLIAIAASFGACYILKIRNAEQKLRVCGHNVHLAQQYMLVALCSIPIFLMAGAGTAIFWILGASFFFIMLHASFYNIDMIQQQDAFSLSMETI